METGSIGGKTGMAEIINLRMARKARVRADKEKQADANRNLTRLSRIERQYREQEEKRAGRALDGMKLTPDSPADGSPNDKDND